VGAFVAKENIALGEALAYTRGQRVEADAVKANHWEELVVGENTKEARAIQAEITGQPAEESAPSTSRSAASTTEQKG